MKIEVLVNIPEKQLSIDKERIELSSDFCDADLQSLEDDGEALHLRYRDLEKGSEDNSPAEIDLERVYECLTERDLDGRISPAVTYVPNEEREGYVTPYLALVGDEVDFRVD